MIDHFSDFQFYSASFWIMYNYIYTLIPQAFQSYVSARRLDLSQRAMALQEIISILKGRRIRSLPPR